MGLLIGGLDGRDPWKKRIGITRPYFEERVLVGIRPSALQPETLKGLNVAGGEVAGLLRAKDAHTLRVDRLSAAADAAAAAIISIEILRDGAEDLRNSVAQLMDKRPTDIDGKHPDPIADERQYALSRLPWVEGARSGCARTATC